MSITRTYAKAPAKTPPARRGPGAQPAARHPAARLQQQMGNARVARLLAQREFARELAPEVGRQGGPLGPSLASGVRSNLRLGQSLDEGTRAEAEAAFETSFAEVRVHTDAASAALNRRLGARAFTIGSDIFFGSDFSPADRALLAHELAHVAQQRAATPNGPLAAGPADDAYEREAEQASAALAAGESASVSAAAPAAETPAASVQCDLLEDVIGTVGTIGDVTGVFTSPMQAALEASNAPLAAMMGTTPAAITNTHGLSTLNSILAPIGMLTGAYNTGQSAAQMVGGRTRSDQLQGAVDTLFNVAGTASGAIGTASLLGTASSALGTGGSLAAATASGTLLGSAGAVLGAGAGGYALGRLLDQGVNAVGQAVSGDTRGDYSISGGLASLMTGGDRLATSAMRSLGIFDSSRPAYTQTLGWRLGEWLGI